MERWAPRYPVVPTPSPWIHYDLLTRCFSGRIRDPGNPLYINGFEYEVLEYRSVSDWRNGAFQS